MKIDPLHADAISELINIGIGRAAGILNDMVASHVTLNVPAIEILTPGEVMAVLSKHGVASFSCVRMDFTGGINGTASLLFPPESAKKFVTLLLGDDTDEDELDALKLESVTEVGNIVINNIMGSITNILEQHVDYRLPVYLEEPLDSIISRVTGDSGKIILAHANFTIREHGIAGEVMLLFDRQAFDHLITAVDNLYK